jgi:hypothetical protein
MSRKLIFQDNLTNVRGPLHEDQLNIHFWSYLIHLFLEREMFLQTNVAEEIKTHILCSIIVFSKK